MLQTALVLQILFVIYYIKSPSQQSRFPLDRDFLLCNLYIHYLFLDTSAFEHIKVHTL